ncbi:Cu/Ag efflux pump CusA [Amycolatopsis xylanica]|uniref:Cu/Ag efflux pump CusA n=1 Tax=Amycolatopsis xylanica TaxID=589385 RepID=A0A1H2SX39_9PSEU|nr:efflux RND transporter permease subunit [Amycolatopsis xylanica]SDW36150.1 Cu/Ag efflux pump CusA [Amycolatopsis xylanica]
MTRWIVGQSVRLRLLVLLGAVAVLLFGFVRIRDAAVDVLPEFSPTSVEVQTEALGLSAAEVEQLITVPLEADLLNGVAWLDTIRSESVPGLSSLTLVFEPGTDPLRARQVVQERITQAKALPNVSKPPIMLEPLSSSSRVLMIGLTPKELSLIDTSVLARWTVKPRLMGVPGVANVAIWGQRDQQLQVQVDPKRLAANDVSLAQVLQTTGNAMWVSPLSYLEASTPGTGGFFDTANQRLGIQHVSPIVSAEDLAKVTVEDTPNRIVRLGDVTTVVKDHQPLIGDSANHGKPSLMLVVEKFPGADTLAVTEGLDKAMSDLAPGLRGIDVDTGVFRPATFLESAMGNVGLWLLIGGVLMLLVLVLVLSWRAALVAAVSIAVSLGAAALVLGLTGATINLMTVAGLVTAVGFVVGDVLADLHAARRGTGLVDAFTAARRPALFTTAISLLVVVPVFFLGGQAREFYQPLALAYGLAVLASLVAALTVTPALSALLLSRGASVRREPRFPAGAFAHPRRIVIAAFVVVLATLALTPLLNRSLLPSAKDPDLLVQFDAPPGTSLPEMNRITARASDELSRIGGVKNVATQIGRAMLADQVVGTGSSQLWVTLDTGADYDLALGEVKRAIAGYPGIKSDVLTYDKRRSAELLGTASKDLTVRLYGQDPAVLQGKAAEVLKLVSGVEGVVKPRIETEAEEPTMLVEVNLTAAQKFGIKPGDVRRAAATLVNGTEVGSLYEGQKIFEVIVRGTPDAKHSLSGVRDLTIESPAGTRVRLGDVADVKVGSKPTVIKREDVSRRVDITASVSGRSVGSVSADVESKIKNVAFPLEYHAAVLGDRAREQSDNWRVLAISIAALIGVFLVLQQAFSSWRLATATFFALPFALAGGVLTTWLVNGELSLGSVAGLLLVFGIAARGTLARDNLGVHLAVGLFFLPALFFGPAAGLEIIHPMAIAVLGGLITSLLLTTFVVPALTPAATKEGTEDAHQ